MLGNQVMVMLTSLPTFGTLIYTDGDGFTREITQADLYNPTSSQLGTEFDPNFISYIPGNENLFDFGDLDSTDVTDGQWGTSNVDDTQRTFTLDNGAVITLSMYKNAGTDHPSTFELYTGSNGNDGYGLGDTDGNGINSGEHLDIDLTENPLEVVYFGLDGAGGAQNENSNSPVTVDYLLESGTVVSVEYTKTSGDVGNEQLAYEFSYSSPDDPIVGISLIGNGGNWVLRYFSGAEDSPDQDSFNYVAIDSGQPENASGDEVKLVSDEATVTLDISESSSYQVFSAANGDGDEQGNLYAELGNDVFIGDDQANIFTWLDSTLDTSRDVIVDFELGNDKVDLLDILSDSPSTQEFNELIDSISVSVSGDNVELEVPINQDDSQTIVFENGVSLFDTYIDSGAITQQNELLNALLKDPSS